MSGQVGQCEMKETRDFKLSRRAIDGNDKEKAHFNKVLPVLFLEYLAISLTRTLFPGFMTFFCNKLFLK